MANRRKPDEEKRAGGETRPSRMNANNTFEVLQFPKVNECPDPPAFIQNARSMITGEQYGLDLWNQITEQLVAQKVLTSADGPVLAHLCMLHQKACECYEKAEKPVAADLAQMRLYFTEFGMTPASRTRVGKSGDTGNKNKFNDNGKKKA